MDKGMLQSIRNIEKPLTTLPVLPYQTSPSHLSLTQMPVSAVLSQQYKENETVVSYASCSLSKSEQRYCVTRKELLASVALICIFLHLLIPIVCLFL